MYIIEIIGLKQYNEIVYVITTKGHIDAYRYGTITTLIIYLDNLITCNWCWLVGSKMLALKGANSKLSFLMGESWQVGSMDCIGLYEYNPNRYRVVIP